MRAPLLLIVVIASTVDVAQAQSLPRASGDLLHEIDSVYRVMVRDTTLLGPLLHADRQKRNAGISAHDRAIQGIAAGMVLQSMVRVDDAVIVLDRTIDQMSGTSDERTLACALYYRGRAELVRNNIAGAIVQFERALRITSKFDYRKLDGLLEDGIGRAYAELQDYEKCRIHMLRALTKAPDAGMASTCLSVLIEAEARSGAFDEAEAHIRRFEAVNDSLGVAPAYAELSRGELGLARGNNEQTMEHFRTALAYFMVEGRRITTFRAWIMSRLSKALRLAGRHAEALELARQGFQFSVQNGLRKEIQDNERELYLAYAAMGDKAAAYDHLQHYLALQDSATGVVASGIVGTSVLRSELARQAMADSLLRAERDMRVALERQAERSRQNYVRNITLLGSGGLLVLAIGLWNRLRFVRRSRAEIQREKEISEGLLLNILPEEVADELKATGHADAKHFDSATILFSDFKGFTQVSELLSPEELVKELNACFEVFDQIITARGIEKIKTIGDAYMAAGGLPDPQHGSPADVVRAALEMQAFMKAHKAEREAQSKPYFEMRVGIHTGPVVAGIVGVKKFQYDIWGDTVNTASRMESSGEVGQVNISEATYELVKNEHGLRFTPRGKVQAKGKGEMEMYFVLRSPEA